MINAESLAPVLGPTETKRLLAMTKSLGECCSASAMARAYELANRPPQMKHIDSDQIIIRVARFIELACGRVFRISWEAQFKMVHRK